MQIQTRIGAVINSVYGSAATRLQRPASPAPSSGLRIKADKGAWRIRVGNVTGAMPAAALPTAAVSDGTGGWYLPEGQEMLLDGLDDYTVKGYAVDSVLTYTWI